jgi:UDP-glucose:(heptosyl)LPS alpha-1,3-glucosyltransferase
VSRVVTVALVAQGIHDRGGMERALAELVRRAGPGYRFVVLAAELADDLRPRVQWLRVPVPMRPMPLKLVLFAALAGARLARVEADLVHVTGALVPNRADLASVHYCHAGYRAHTGRLAPPSATAPRRLNTALKTALALAGERWCYRPERLRLLGAVSLGVRSELEHHYPGVPIVLTPNGVDTDRFRPDAAAGESLRRAEGIDPQAVVALLVGGDWDRKGLKIAIESLVHAPAVSLWVVGRGDERRFAGLAAAHGVADRVRFHGARNDTERFYQAADLFVLPTLYETFSLVAFEAAACGLPLVVTRVNGVEELIGDDTAGLTVERSPAAVGAALARLAEDGELRRQLGTTARERAQAYTWSRSVESVLAAYDRLLEPATAGAAA